MADPLGDRAEAGGDVVKREATGARRQAVGDTEDRRAVFVSLGQGAIGHLEPGGVEAAHDGTDTDLLAVGDPGESIGHGHGIAFFPHHDERDAFFDQGVVHVTGRIDGDPRDTFGLEDARQPLCCCDFHHCPPDFLVAPALAGCLARPDRAIAQVSLNGQPMIAAFGRYLPGIERIRPCF
ncbi:MAG: hypothetical protein ABSF48_03365 [Thermodesulfobacteriota bacterium]